MIHAAPGLHFNWIFLPFYLYLCNIVGFSSLQSLLYRLFFHIFTLLTRVKFLRRNCIPFVYYVSYQICNSSCSNLMALFNLAHRQDKQLHQTVNSANQLYRPFSEKQRLLSLHLTKQSFVLCSSLYQAFAAIILKLKINFINVLFAIGKSNLFYALV